MSRQGARRAMLAVIAVALLSVGYGVGRWTSRRSGGELAAGTALQSAAAAAPVASADRAEVGSVDLSDASLEEVGSRSPDLAERGDVEESGTLSARRQDAAPGAGIAIVIDDLGRSLDVIDQLRALGVPLTYAVLPFEPRSSEVARRLAELDEEVLCHLPMAARRGEDPGPGALHAAMRPRELRASTRRALDAVPGADGVNNHMGSALSEDRAAMAAVLEVVRAHGLFYLDSRTSPASVGYTLARDLGMPAAERKVFLDRDRDPEAIRREFRRLLALSGAGAPAIAIGHPYAETLAVLREEIPRARSAGYRFVRVSEVIAGE